MDTAALELQHTFHREIPITRHMGLEVAGYDGRVLTLQAPLAPNTNHKSTAFGGSLYTVAVLSGWGLLHLKLGEWAMEGHIVIQSSQMEYRVPVVDTLLAHCALPADTVLDRFRQIYRRHGKGRIGLQSEIVQADKVAARFSGEYVIHR